MRMIADAPHISVLVTQSLPVRFRLRHAPPHSQQMRRRLSSAPVTHRTPQDLLVRPALVAAATSNATKTGRSDLHIGPRQREVETEPYRCSFFVLPKSLQTLHIAVQA